MISPVNPLLPGVAKKLVMSTNSYADSRGIGRFPINLDGKERIGSLLAGAALVAAGLFRSGSARWVLIGGGQAS